MAALAASGVNVEVLVEAGTVRTATEALERLGFDNGRGRTWQRGGTGEAKHYAKQVVLPCGTPPVHPEVSRFIRV